VVEQLRKAQEWQRQLVAGEVTNRAAIARREGITRARVTQLMALVRLAPEIREHILGMPKTVGRPAISERALRPIVRVENHKKPLERFRAVGSVAL
jgi:ParB-like chromosome segregation protein Spo0J